VGHLHRLVVFDLDGTLIDSRRDLAESANQLIQELGGRTLSEDAIGQMVGEGAALLVRRALQAAGIGKVEAALPRFLEIYDTRLLNHTTVYPGVREAIVAAREAARVTVLTNKPERPTNRILEALGLRELFDEVVGGDGAYPRKPDPKGLWAMMASAEATPRQTLLVGDSAIDHETARRASARCCIVSYGFGYQHVLREERSGHDWLVDDAFALKKVIEEFKEISETP
jgi:phosphoglycolate phosphatase